MENKKPLIDYTYINETLYGDKGFLKEFSEAAKLSFSEFKGNYQKYLLSRNETELRKAGHKIKPVAQMLKIEAVLNEYEHAKELLLKGSREEELEKSAKKMNAICEEILLELEENIAQN